MGYNTYINTYEDIVEQMMYEIMELRRKDVEKEYDRFQRELNRVTKPTN